MQKVTKLRVLSRTLASLRWTLFIMFVPLVSFILISTKVVDASFWVPAFLVAALWGAALVPSLVWVGCDGILIGWVGRRRFIPLRDVASADDYVSSFGNDNLVGTAIVLRSGETIRIPVCYASDDAKARALTRCIGDAIAGYDRGAVRDDTSFLGRQGRDVPEWTKALRALGEGSQGVAFREAPVQPEVLWRIAESPSSNVEDRAAAAVALRTIVDSEGKKRLRILADAIVEPKLRVVIGSVAEGTDDEIEAALVKATAS